MRLFVFKLKTDKLTAMDNPQLTPDDASKSPAGDGLQVLQQEYLIGEVLDLLFRGKDSEGRAYSLEGACKEVGVAPSTWYRWTKEGALDPHKAALAAQMSGAIQDIVIPRYREIFEGLVSLALGERPAGASPLVQIKSGDMIRAIKLLMTIVPINPLTTDQRDAAADAQDYLDGTQFKQIFVQGDMNFIYQGNGQPQFGELDTQNTGAGGDEPDVIDP
jgi:hypothetical protein